MSEALENTVPSREKPTADSPGTLRSDVTMQIQTRQAQRLVTGRKRGEGVEPIIGVLDFGRRTGLIWRAAENDDPYADYFVLQIETAIDAAKQAIDTHSRRIGDVLKAMDGFRIEIAHSMEPIHIPLQFSNPYGYMGAYLVADYDALARTVLTARHLGLIDRQRSEETLRAMQRAIRRTFNLSVQWRFTGVVREDFRQMNQNAQRARDLMGDLPEEVLTGAKRARMAPAIVSSARRGFDAETPADRPETLEESDSDRDHDVEIPRIGVA